MEITTNDAAKTRQKTPLWFRILCIGLTLAAYLSGLNVPLMGPDESRYAQVAREMYERGDWVTPTLAGHPWFEKPPVLYWLEIVSYHIFGQNEFAARVGPALCGLGIIAALWVLARAEDRTSAGLLGLMAASTVGLIAFSHTAGFDVVLTLTITCSLTSFWTFEKLREGRGILPLVSFYFFIGLAILAKGLVGLFPLAIVALFYVVSRRMPPRRMLLSIVWGLPLVFAIAAPWHIGEYLRHGREFVDIYLVQHHFERFTSNKYLHPQPFYFFWWVLPLLALPWAALAVAAAGNAVRKRKDRLVSSSPLLVFSLCWLIVPLVFFSLSGSKLPGYILPAVPPVVIIAWQWLRAQTQGRHTAARIASILILFGSLVVIVAKLPAYAARDSVKGLVETADSRGHSTERILTLHMVSHNAEFYACDRLFRDAEGKQIMLEGAQLVLEQIKKDGRSVLVLVPVEYASQLTEYSKVTAEVLGDNGTVAIVAVAAR